MSLTVTMPVSSNASLTKSTFSMRCSCNKWVISWKSVPSTAVTSRSLGVMISLTRASVRRSKRKSRLVIMPTSVVPSTTGTPETPFSRVKARSSSSVAFGSMVTASRIMPDSYFLTARTSLACSSTVIFLCTMPMPPSCAMAIARRASVTVSIAEDISGIFNEIFLDTRLCRAT